MPRQSVIRALALCVSVAGCSGSPPPDEAKPVATPSLTLTPAVVSSGRPLNLTWRFAVAPDAPAFAEDYTVFVHVLDDSGRMIGAVDHEPPTPTREWKAGSTVEYTQPAFAPTSRYVGNATVVVGLYSRNSGERLPLAGEAVEPRAVKVGTFEMRERSDPYEVIYQEGWHRAESPRGAGIEWRWSTKSGMLSFANPRKDSDLVLELDQPNDVFEIPQHVDVKIGETVVDAFDVAPGRPVLRRIELPAAELGSGERVQIAVVADKTFVPARIARLQSSDDRQLGLRVFRAYVEPKQ